MKRKKAKKLADLVYFRNLAAHEYHSFDEKDVFKAFEKIDIVEKFVKDIKKIAK